MYHAAFVGFGEVNSPLEIIEKKCERAIASLKREGISLCSVYPVLDDPQEEQIQKASDALRAERFDCLVLCVAGWIPSHAVIKITEQFRHLPMVLWGLCGWIEDGRLVTTADQAGTSALRKTFADLGYTFTYLYDIIGKESRAPVAAGYIKAACAARELRSQKAGFMGYRDMNLYGTLFDGASLKKTTGVEIETFEMLQVKQRFDQITPEERQEVVARDILPWNFLKKANPESLSLAAGYYLALSSLAAERNYQAISLKDVDGMKKLLGFPPAPIFMLLANRDRLCTIPENDSLGSVTQMIVKALTGQIGAYLEFYEFFENSVLAGVPDYIPQEITEGEITVVPAAFGELSEGILNVSKIKPGLLTLCRLVYTDGQYFLHMVKAQGKTPMRWEEAGWAQPAPQLPGLELLMDDVPAFAQNVMGQHYIIAYGDHTDALKALCGIWGIGVIS